MSAPSFTVGIEEEFFLVDRVSRDLVTDPTTHVVEAAEKQMPGQISPEFLRCQIEVGTKVCKSVPEAGADLRALRNAVRSAAMEDGKAMIAASTHPFAQWQDQKPTDKDRYATIAEDLQAVVRRLVICGMHVHVCIEDSDLRIDLMNQVRYFLPHLLVLSTSSPFWRGENTGLRSYRCAVFKELPRTGLPELFDSWGEYERHVRALTDAGLIEDSSKIWWDVRPSSRYPTLEMRMPDVCTRVEDSLTVAAFFQCLISMLYRLRRSNQRWRVYARMLVEENRWRAQRYGLDSGLVDFGIGKVVPYPELLEELIELVMEDAERLGCVDQILNARKIIQRGTSAHRQVSVYDEVLKATGDREKALHAVVDMLIADTAIGLDL
ncbi:MAG: carboxylate-amine ligase [Pseudomonadota bacterium]